ncbi:MAG: ABC transporter ATP-binding protein [Chloroflexi bacterium]|nr:ABC transporter ATP-binding protein [Chloroflexota bacterium]
MVNQQQDDTFAAELRNASKHFGSVRALDGVSFAVTQGERLALLGPNGAGKTTAISLMLGLRRPTAGSAALFGRDPRDAASRRRVGVMLQESGVPETLKVGEAVELFRRLYPRPLTVEEALDAAGLERKATTLVSNLSGGQKQRLYFALAIVGDPDLLFLDEPTVGLDVGARQVFWSYIDGLVGRGKTIVLTAHYLEEADALADRIVVIDEGRIIAEGSPSAIKARVGGKTVRFRAPGLDEARLVALTNLESARRTGDRFEVYTLRPEEILARLFAAGVELDELEVVGAGLEEAFLALTKEREGVAT